MDYKTLSLAGKKRSVQHKAKGANGGQVYTAYGGLGSAQGRRTTTQSGTASRTSTAFPGSRQPMYAEAAAKLIFDPKSKSKPMSHVSSLATLRPTLSQSMISQKRKATGKLRDNLMIKHNNNYMAIYGSKDSRERRTATKVNTTLDLSSL